MIYSQENGILADGELMFESLENYVKRMEIPVISRDQFLSADLTYDAYITQISCSTYFYLNTDDGLRQLGDKNAELSELPEGTYLIRMDCSAKHNEEYYYFCYLFWVTSPTPFPTLPPTPTPLPTFPPTPTPTFAPGST